MNEIVVDKRIFLQAKKRSNTKSILPQIKYPFNFNLNGSNILRRINDEMMVPKENPFKHKSYQPPLSNILISKRITPIHPFDSPNNQKRKQNNSFAPKQQLIRKLQIECEVGADNSEKAKTKTTTSLSQRIGFRPSEKLVPHLQSEESRSMKVSKTDELTVVIGKANNNEELVKEVLYQRKVWREIKYGEGIPHLKWIFGKEKHNFKKMASFTQTRAVNHFEFNDELTTKDNLIRNLQLYCETKKMEVFSITPVTFIIDFDDEYCEYNLKQFLSFFYKNDPRKNLALAKKNTVSAFNFVSRFQPYMAWQNSDIKKKVNILSRPVNNVTYYSDDPSSPSYVWLLKPTGLNRGRGIEIFDHLETLEKMLMDFLVHMNRKNYRENKEKDRRKTKAEQYKCETKQSVQTQNQLSKSEIKMENKEKEGNDEEKPADEQTEDAKCCRENFKLSVCSFVIQKYVERPFLIQKRKFDIRVWTLLAQNLTLYFFKEGYIRTSAETFQVKDIDNYFIHLTNNAIQKNSASYGLFENGNQLSFRDLVKVVGEEQTDRIWERMKQIAYMTFSSVNKKINQNQRKFCFEIFGLDFILDGELKVWLIEVNENPCLECSSPLLSKLIPRMLNDAFKLTIDQIFTQKRPTEKTYAVPGYANAENMWQVLGQLGPNAEYLRNKSSGKQSLRDSTLGECLTQLKQVEQAKETEQKKIALSVG